LTRFAGRSPFAAAAAEEEEEDEEEEEEDEDEEEEDPSLMLSFWSWFSLLCANLPANIVRCKCCVDFTVNGVERSVLTHTSELESEWDDSQLQ
jgi:CO dehydrogenase/acetyl-CoA synthase beta subunit